MVGCILYVCESYGCIGNLCMGIGEKSVKCFDILCFLIGFYGC